MTPFLQYWTLRLWIKGLFINLSSLVISLFDNRIKIYSKCLLRESVPINISSKPEYNISFGTNTSTYYSGS